MQRWRVAVKCQERLQLVSSDERVRQVVALVFAACAYPWWVNHQRNIPSVLKVNLERLLCVSNTGQAVSPRRTVCECPCHKHQMMLLVSPCGAVAWGLRCGYAATAQVGPHATPERLRSVGYDVSMRPAAVFCSTARSSMILHGCRLQAQRCVRWLWRSGGSTLEVCSGLQACTTFMASPCRWRGRHAVLCFKGLCLSDSGWF